MVFKGIFRVVAVAAVAAAFCVAATTAGAGTARPRATQAGLTSLERGVLADINSFRASHGLTALKLSTQLTLAARQHSQEMASDGYFAHTSNNGSAFWQRIQHFYGSGSFGYWSVGENLLWSSPDVSASGALELWEHSPEHLANLLAPRWREIGISAVHVATAPGVYNGMPVTIVTTDFGVRH